MPSLTSDGTTTESMMEGLGVGADLAHEVKTSTEGGNSSTEAGADTAHGDAPEHPQNPNKVLGIMQEERSKSSGEIVDGSMKIKKR